MNNKIPLKSIDFKASPVVRAEMSEDTVAEYADSYRNRQPMPPVTVFIDAKTGQTLLADGAHRCAAAAQAGHTEIECNIRQGGYDEALNFALSANTVHGLRRTNADKRTCVRQAITRWPKSSNAVIAKACVVDDHLVKLVRDEMETKQEVKPEPMRIGADGKEQPASKDRKEKGVQDCVYDKVGTPIPISIITFWYRAKEIESMLEPLRTLTEQLAIAAESGDVMFAEVNLQAAANDLISAGERIAAAIPYAVCTQCQGHPDTQKTCRLCLGRGLISKFRYNRLVPDEIKALKSQSK